MKRFWVVAALAPLSFAAQAAHAQTDVSGNTPVQTATANNGQPADVDVTGGMNPASGVAVTLNSNNNVTNDSSIVIQNATAPSVGIQALGGFTGTITNNGTIEIDEGTSYSDTNGDNIVDSNNNVLGQYASGSNRYGIELTGATPLVGNIVNSGTISIIGEDSAGILIGAGGLQGNLTSSGSISIVGGNAGTADVSYGILSQGPITGLVNLNTDAVSAVGANAKAVDLEGAVGGSVEVSTTVTGTGYRSTTAPLDPNVLAKVYQQESSELLQGGAVFTLAGGAGGGFSLDAPAAATSTVNATTGAVITSYGSAPAVVLGGSSASTFGLYGATNFGVLIGGTVSGSSVYDRDENGNPVNANAMQIGMGAGQVTINGGIDISGAVLASLSRADLAVNGLTADAIALNIDNAKTPLIQVEAGGAIEAVAAASTAVHVTALQLGPSAQVSNLTNYGLITAQITGITGYLNETQSTGGTIGAATAVSDQSGSLTTITNYATIAASVTPIVDLGTVDPTQTRTIAIDLSANTTGATINQVLDPTLVYSTTNLATGVQTITTVPTVYGTNPLTPGATTTEVLVTPTTIANTDNKNIPAAVVPEIIGDVLFGSGAGTLNLGAGILIGGLSYGTSTGNALNISGGAVETGDLAEAAGGALALNITNGALNITAPTTNSLPSPTNLTPAQATLGASTINVGAAGQLVFSVYAPSSSNTVIQNAVITGAQLNASGAVTFASGGTLGLNFLNKLTSPATYDIITAGTGNITVGDLNTVVGSLPYLYSGTASIAALSPTEDALAISVIAKTPQQLGLNTAEAAAFPAIDNAFGLDSGVSAAMLSQTSKAAFTHFYDQFLPDYEGGPFESLALGQRQLAKAEAEAPVKLPDGETRGWVQEIGFLDNRDADSQANGYRAGGFGLAGGVEHNRGGSVFGLAAAFLTDGVSDAGQGPGGAVSSSAIEVGAYWRTSGRGLNAHADLNGGYVYMNSERLVFDEDSAGDTLYRLAKSQWNGAVASADVGLSYQMDAGRYFLRPEVSANYTMLYEGAYTEHGGGAAVDLAVASRTNQEATVEADMVLGARFGDAIVWEPQVTIGWREVVFGGPADTTAVFVSGGPAFTLSPAFDDHGGLLARLGLHAGGAYADFSADAGGEYRNSYQSYDARAVARFLF